MSATTDTTSISAHASTARDIWAVAEITHSILSYLDLSSFDPLLSVLQAMPELRSYLQDTSLWTDLSRLHFGGPRDAGLQVEDGSIQDRNEDLTIREHTCPELQQFLQSADALENFNETVTIIEGDIGTIENIDGNTLDGIVFPTGSTLMNPYMGAAGVVFHRAGRGLDEFVRTQSFRESLPSGEGWLPAGSAIATVAFEAGVEKLIHCVGPSIVMADCYELLARTYEDAMDVVLREELHCVALVSVSTGNQGVPCAEGARVALRSIQKFLTRRGTWDGKLAVICNDESVLRAFESEKAALLNDFNVVPPLPVADSGERWFS